MNLLIVDDEYEKVRALAAALEGASVKCEIRHETTASAARAAMRQVEYDMLLVDLFLPGQVGAPQNSHGGMDLISLLYTDEKVRFPANVIVLTSREDLMSEVRDQAASLGVEVCRFSPSETEWQKRIVGRMHLLSRRQTNVDNIPRVDVAVIVALHSPELDAVLELPFNFKPVNFPADPTTYYVGMGTRTDGSAFSILAAAAQRKGMASSASLASKIAEKFSPKFLVMAGICAGISGETAIGDIIIADPTWDWGSGKHAVDLKGEKIFKIAPHQCGLDASIADLVRRIIRDGSVLKQIRASWNGEVPAGQLTIRLGPMASGGSVVADRQIAADVLKQNKDLIAIEMEAYAVMSAVQYAQLPAPIPIVVKSVCDHADEQKNNDWQRYAAFTSARFLEAILAQLN